MGTQRTLSNLQHPQRCALALWGVLVSVRAGDIGDLSSGRRGQGIIRSLRRDSFE